MSNKRKFRQNNWRDRVTYINQYESENSNYVSTVVRKQKGKRHASFRKTEKYLAENISTGKMETAIVFPNGKTFVGADVWRMSNRADFCEYGFTTYQNRIMAEKDYNFYPAPRTFNENMEVVCNQEPTPMR